MSVGSRNKKQKTLLYFFNEMNINRKTGKVYFIIVMIILPLTSGAADRANFLLAATLNIFRKFSMFTDYKVQGERNRNTFQSLHHMTLTENLKPKAAMRKDIKQK